MSEQWEEIPIEDVQPGDVARCNGREFLVEPDEPASIRDWRIAFGHLQLDDACKVILKSLGFTFHRKVKREPRTCVSTVQNGVLFSIAYLPGSWDNGIRVRVTELLDGEDGA